MSREIEFRGLRKDGKGWVYGFLLSPNRIMVWDRDVCMRSESFEVHPETVGQYPGLKDKNGTDLDWWKGDIVRDERRYINKREMIFQIVFSQGCFWLKSIHGKTCLTAESMTACLHDFTKIGNIHENPELLEAKP